MAGIYIHIPFCSKRCIYCGFYSTTAVRDTNRYIDAICKELKMRTNYLKYNTIKTIYIGGGTPSLLNHHQLERIFSTIRDNYNISQVEEVTLECNPNDLTTNYIAQLQKLPINRISMGVQSFEDSILNFLRRRHNAEQAINAVQECQKAGFRNISIDLIYGIPGQSDHSFKNDIKRAVSLGVTHISSYHLSYEENTPLWKQLQNGDIDVIDEESSVNMYNILCSTLSQHNYLHYEISNFAIDGFQSKHNSSYWNGTPYLGIGASAHSFNGSARRWNPDNLGLYIDSIECGNPIYEEEMLSATDLYNEAIMLGLRKSEGIQLTDFRNRFGDSLYEKLMHNAQPYIYTGSLIKEIDRIRISEHGLFISDNIISSLFIVD